jgi:hypothetical protein
MLLEILGLSEIGTLHPQNLASVPASPSLIGSAFGGYDVADQAHTKKIFRNVGCPRRDIEDHPNC